ncbi:MAG: ABC transporter [Candidatus Yanofskybacteria bacterium CG10_big_fil_rev_8_21_14_0_10_37_15]|uniref:ABC transporter n=1 Tax=Candidatus Yanofskybacteria bacterium CG10_big_fil_rev_8_21_14_0_10_37_15 TaxID=1975097 RepID=A0A2H0R621_9BACT|nr:MAG: ABC transporter [Candidatus Yanofskybacteria bacterium CG10_big_fil_rev_8_21_14_0_10_37_15]
MSDILILQLITGVLIGLGAGYLGSFMILKRMSLVGDVISHVALPGIAIALLFKINPFFGAFGALLLAVLGIWFLERKTEIPSETLVGIFFALSLAVGILITPEPELLEALFGDIAKITLIDVLITAILTMVMFFIIAKIYRGLTLSVISKELAQSAGVNVSKTSFLFLLLLALVVALGLQVTGTFLMGALVIVPAAAAKNISVNLKNYTLSASLFGALSGLIGILIASYFNFHPGPIVVLTSGVIFIISLLFKK